MKSNKSIFSLFAATVITLGSVQAQSNGSEDSTGLPGDNFSLQGALEMFKKANSPEEFEQLLNSESNNVNNLDLNGDGETDYIKVIDKKDGDIHVFVLQAAISETENQDIAVIEIEKTGAQNAILQIVGDEDIYGQETIVEPDSDDEGVSVGNSGARFSHGPAAGYNDNGVSGIIVNVWFWPSVRFIYAPSYVVWTSPWGWRNRPAWWRPWRPVHYQVFYPRRVHYNRHYTVVHVNRITRANSFYRPLRVSSVTVRTTTRASVGRYGTERTIQRRSVTVSNGNRQVHVNRGTTKVQGRSGKVKVRKTTTHVKRGHR